MTGEQVEVFLRDASPLMESLDGWYMFVESSGGWCWTNEEHCLAVYASPFWDDLAGIPFQMCSYSVSGADDEDDELVSAFIPFTLTGDLNVDVEAYRNAIRPFFMLRAGARAFTGNLPGIS